MCPSDPIASDDGPEGPLDDYLTRLADGRRLSSEELAPIVYDDLRQLARQLFRRERVGITIQPTALVHEAYLRLADQKQEGWENRAQFMAVAALAMRRVLAGAARDRGRLKRGGGFERVTLQGHEPQHEPQPIDLLALEDALQALARVKERYARIAELRYFAGLTIGEVAQLLGVSRTIIDREWAKARAYLALSLGGGDEESP